MSDGIAKAIDYAWVNEDDDFFHQNSSCVGHARCKSLLIYLESMQLKRVTLFGVATLVAIRQILSFFRAAAMAVCD